VKGLPRRIKIVELNACKLYEVTWAEFGDDGRASTLAVATKKRRTREHIIADMSVHYLGYLIVRCGFTFGVIEADYGYDGFIFTYDDQDEVENSNMFVQLKATDAVRLSKDQQRVRFRLSKKDISLWQD
jgi:hypothetical protein